jgi:16S rRNA (uracil1498-N3)-methyltransferase
VAEPVPDAVTPARAHAFVPDLDSPQLEPSDRHHLERVLRIRPGEIVTVSDGRGGVRRCRFGPPLEPVAAVERVPRSRPLLAVAFALTKGQRPELVVQKLTELGIDSIVPMAAERSVVRWDPAQAAHHVERLRRVAREAAMQCRRVWLPEVEDMSAFAEVTARSGAAMAEQGGQPPTLAHPLVLVGPEGGWSDAELESDLPRVDLGPQVLRAETAALAAGVVLSSLRARLVLPVA